MQAKYNIITLALYIEFIISQECMEQLIHNSMNL